MNEQNIGASSHSEKELIVLNFWQILTHTKVFFLNILFWSNILYLAISQRLLCDHTIFSSVSIQFFFHMCHFSHLLCTSIASLSCLTGQATLGRHKRLFQPVQIYGRAQEIPHFHPNPLHEAGVLRSQREGLWAETRLNTQRALFKHEAGNRPKTFLKAFFYKVGIYPFKDEHRPLSSFFLAERIAAPTFFMIILMSAATKCWLTDTVHRLQLKIKQTEKKERKWCFFLPLAVRFVLQWILFLGRKLIFAE